MASISRDIFTENKPASRGFISLLGFISFQPRKFFRVLDRIASKHSILAAILVLALVSFSAIQQAGLAANATMPSMDAEFLSEGEEPLTEEVVVSTDPSENWMIGLSTVGKQAIYWLVLAVVLCEISLFKGRAPKFGRNVQIAIWSSIPFAAMAALQILFVMGGGTIKEAGFTGFLDEWLPYQSIEPKMQSAVYALAAQFNFFTLWNFVLLYHGGRETLRGNRLVVFLVLASWLLMQTFVIGYEHYQQHLNMDDFGADDYSYETLPEGEMYDEELYYPEDEMGGEELYYPEDEMGDEFSYPEDEINGEEMP